MTAKLKSLELQGYKTFAHKTIFEFPSKITAIVGPNGSGKSNIADAIRWVLGEQSYSLLRGKKTVDMIFIGSDQKARAGLASASILFDNEDTWLPIDYEEVAITRRAFRSGENDYAINGQRVRLKDIRELLGQSGLAERTYTIIGQGLIDNALSLKPDERRRFFEEAAGISLYRSRKEEAIIRLDETRRNLERIADILGELEPRMNSLQRQSKRAGEYERVKSSLTLLLQEWYGYHWHKAQQSLLDSIHYNEEVIKKTENVRAETANFETVVADLQAKIKEKRLDLGVMHDNLSKIHHMLDEINRETAILDERTDAYKRQKTNFTDQAEIFLAEIALLGERIAKQETDLSENQTNLAAALEKKTALESELGTRQAEMNTLQELRSAQRKELTEQETSVIRLRAKSEDILARMTDLEKSNESLELSLSAADSETNALRGKKEALRQTLADLEKEIAAFDLNQISLQQTIRQLEQEKQQKNEKISRLNAEKTAKKAQLDVLEKAEKNLLGLAEGTQFILKKAGIQFSGGEGTTLGSLFAFPKEYEIAAAAVMAESLEAILLDRGEWEKAAEKLNSAENGRAVFIANLNDPGAKTPKPDSKLAHLPSLLTFVDCDPKYSPLAERLFAKTYIVNSIAEGISLQSALNSAEVLVTRTGDVFSSSGSLTTGREHRHQLLSRKREISELNRAVAALSASLESVTADFKILEEKLVNTRKQSELETSKRKSSNEALEKNRKEFNRIELEIQKKDQMIQFQRQRMEENKNSISGFRLEQSETENVIENLNLSIEKLREEVKHLSDTIQQNRLEDLQQEVQHWTLQWRLSEKTAQEIESRIKELKAQLDRNNNQLAGNHEKSAALEASIIENERKRVELTRQSEAILASSRAAKEEIDPQNAEVAELETSLEAARTDLTELQNRLSSAEKNQIQSQMEVARQQDQLDALKSRIEDDFGLVAFEYKEKIAGQTPLPLGDMVAELPHPEEISEDLKDQISRQKNLLQRIGPINPEAIEEYQTVSERFAFLKTQSEDLKKADKDLREVIADLDEMMKNAFEITFEKVQVEFKELFTRLFGGGTAKLVLTNPDNVNQSGIDIEAKLPGRKSQELSLLSGGERSLTSIALVFSLLKVSPTPFCVLDEVDAALDEANVGRFCGLLKDLSETIQFILITHNRNTVEIADVIYGITMGSDSASKVVSLRLDEISSQAYLI